MHLLITIKLGLTLSQMTIYLSENCNITRNPINAKIVVSAISVGLSSDFRAPATC
jgi:hypothetical protein